MQCPQCKSDNVQKLSLIYESGTQKINTTSRTAGGGVGYAGGLGGGVGSASTHTTGQSQSLLAKKAEPPKKKTFGVAALILLAGLIAWGVGYFIIFLAALVLAGFIGYKAHRYNQDEYPPKYQDWLKMWHCHKCGTIYAA